MKNRIAPIATLSLLAFVLALAKPAPLGADGPAAVEDLKITILADNIAGRWTNDAWGFSALVEVKTGGVWKKLLFDTGPRPDTVINNARTLGIDLCGIDTVVLSHNHQDHTMGLVAIRESCLPAHPHALGTTYVGGPQMFWTRPYKPGENRMGRRDDNVMVAGNGISGLRVLGLDPQHDGRYEKGVKELYEEDGGRFVVAPAGGPLALAGFPGVWITGAIPRPFDEKTYSDKPYIVDPATGQASSDKIPEDQALVVNTAQGLVVLTGCAHAGATNTLLYAHTMLGAKLKVYALLGGLHMFGMVEGAADKVGTLAWEAAQFSSPELGLQWMLGAHCSGLEQFIYLKAHVRGFDPARGFLSSTGTTFTLAGGVTPPTPAINGRLRKAALETAHGALRRLASNDAE